ncbi:MAG: peptidoglycan editing factor PgeF [Desulforhopalus sp.]
MKNKAKGNFAAHNGAQCRYELFDCQGGVSAGIFTSLNVGAYVGDEDKAVRENRRTVKESLGVPFLLSAKQVHGTEIYCLTEALLENTEVDGVDALVTDLPNIGLMIQQADCQAVLLFDQVKAVIAAIHCGWRGSVKGILEKVITIMVENYGTVQADLKAVISPSLGPCCAEFINYRRELPEEFHQFMVRDNYFDFWQISRFQLMNAGVSDKNIETTALCTCCSDNYFSYRRATRCSGGVTGRNCSVISLQQTPA